MYRVNSDLRDSQKLSQMYTKAGYKYLPIPRKLFNSLRGSRSYMAVHQSRAIVYAGTTWYGPAYLAFHRYLTGTHREHDLQSMFFKYRLLKCSLCTFGSWKKTLSVVESAPALSVSLGDSLSWVCFQKSILRNIIFVFKATIWVIHNVVSFIALLPRVPQNRS